MTDETLLRWVEAASPRSQLAWRGVESQHEIATLALVDTREEHELLEALLEASKPPLPPGGERMHYLLSTPFRYASPQASRFRSGSDPGIWYGADSLIAACAEVAYWSHRFILDSSGLAQAVPQQPLLTSHTFFCAEVQGRAVDLVAPPWDVWSDLWTHPTDYTPSQALARHCQAQGVDWIRYASVRQPGAHCVAVLVARALAATRPRDAQEWHCRADRSRVIFHSRARQLTFSWDFA